MFAEASKPYFVILIQTVNIVAAASKPLLCDFETDYQYLLKPPNPFFVIFIVIVNMFAEVSKPLLQKDAQLVTIASKPPTLSLRS
jgi:hypothetical protein